MVKYNFSKNKPEELRKTEKLIGQSINSYREQYLMPCATEDIEKAIGSVGFLSSFFSPLILSAVGTGVVLTVLISITEFIIFLLIFCTLLTMPKRFRWKDNSGKEHFYNRANLGILGTSIAERKTKTALVDVDSKLLVLEAQCNRIGSVIELSNYVEELTNQYGEDSVKFLVQKIEPKNLETKNSKGKREVDYSSSKGEIYDTITIRDNYDVELCYDVEVSLQLADYNSAVTLQTENQHFILSAMELNLIMKERDIIDFSFIDGIYDSIKGELESASKLLSKHEYTEFETIALKEPVLLIEGGE